MWKKINSSEDPVANYNFAISLKIIKIIVIQTPIIHEQFFSSFQQDLLLPQYNHVMHDN